MGIVVFFGVWLALCLLIAGVNACNDAAGRRV